jgi:tetratricopeptide (TPR) repeat protein
MRNLYLLASVVVIVLLSVASVAGAQSVDEWYDMGYYYVLDGDYEKAVECFTKVIELEPENTYACNSRARAYKNLDLYDEAISDYKKTISLDPDDIEAYSGLAFIYYLMGDYTNALEYFTIDINRDPTVTSLDARANIYRELGRYDEAIADIERALKFSATYYKTYYTRGLIYKEIGEKEKAIADIKYACDNGEEEACTDLEKMGE